MGKNPVVTLIAVIILIVAIIMIAKSMSRGSGVVVTGDTRATWYDTGTNKLFGAPAATPPIKAPSGSDGVQAHMFANGSCDNAGDRFIGYLEMYPNKDAIDQAQGAFERAPLMDEAMVRAEDDEEWVNRNSAEGAQLMATVQGLTECFGFME